MRCHPISNVIWIGCSLGPLGMRIVCKLTEGNGGRLEPTCVDFEQRMHFLVVAVDADLFA